MYFRRGSVSRQGFVPIPRSQPIQASSLSPVIIELSRALIRRLVRPRTRTHQCPLYVLRDLFLQTKLEKTTKGKGLQRCLLRGRFLPHGSFRGEASHSGSGRPGSSGYRTCPCGSAWGLAKFAGRLPGPSLALNYDAPSTLHRFYR
jgi:hypothetical protein